MKNPESPVHRFGSAPRPWPAGRSCLPAQAPLLGAGDHPASVRTPAELGSPGMHLWPAVLRGPGDSAPNPLRTAARLFRQLPPRLPAQGGNTLPAGCQRRKCDASARSTSLPSLALLLDVSVPATVSRAPCLASGACRAATHRPPPLVAQPCSVASSIVWACPTPPACASSATPFGFPLRPRSPSTVGRLEVSQIQATCVRTCMGSLTPGGPSPSRITTC